VDRSRFERNEKRRLRRLRNRYDLDPLAPVPHEGTERRPGLGKLDRPLLFVVIILTVIGLTTLFSATATQAFDESGNSLFYVVRQGLFFLFGYGIMFGLSRLPYFAWIRLSKPFALIVIALLLYTLLNGVESYGAERWIRIMGVQFQPSELGKISIILLMAEALRIPFGQRKFNFTLNMVLAGLTIGLIFKQPSLSMTIILSVVSVLLMFISGVRKSFLLSALIPAVILGGLKVMQTPYQLKRITGWLDPWGDQQGTGYNLIQSLFAIGSGGLFGSGLGGSYQKLYYLPFHYTDFIFAIFAEEWGFLGCLGLIALYIAMFYRGYLIAQRSLSPFAQYLAMGITLVLMLQVAINISVATGVFPVTGLTLPFMSYGGTSIIVTFVMLGILLNISRYNALDESVA
jgi:cell division protein FtsW